MKIYVKINEKSIDASQLAPHERQQLVTALRVRLKQLSGLSASKLERTIRQIESLNIKQRRAKRETQKLKRKTSLKSRWGGIVKPDSPARFNGGQGAARFISGGAPGTKR